MRSEFDLINNIKTKYSLSRIGDDCAVVPKNEHYDTVITADMLVEDIDFRLDRTEPESLGHKSLAVSLSDIAAMGATPLFSMVSIAVPEDLWKTDLLDGFYDGWQQLAASIDVETIGGDISRTNGPLVVDSIVIGEVPKGRAILRSGARAGDSIYVSGSLGGAAGGLELLESNIDRGNASDPQEKLVKKQLRPKPQLALAKILIEQVLISAMIDLSDGLSSDLHHICKSSGVGARVYKELVPVDPNLSGSDFSDRRSFELALDGGEDLELLFTSPEKNILLPLPHIVTRIGKITEDIDNIELISDGRSSQIPPKGYSHF